MFFFGSNSDRLLFYVLFVTVGYCTSLYSLVYPTTQLLLSIACVSVVWCYILYIFVMALPQLMICSYCYNLQHVRFPFKFTGRMLDFKGGAFAKIRSQEDTYYLMIMVSLPLSKFLLVPLVFKFVLFLLITYQKSSDNVSCFVYLFI